MVATQKKVTVRCFALLAVMMCSNVVVAQQRPLITEDPEPIGNGLVLIEGGIDYFRDQEYPVSGLRGHLLRVPTFGFSIGISEIAEIQVDNISYQRLRVLDRVEAPLSHLLTVSNNLSSDMDDVVVGAKTLLLRETKHRPAISMRFATRLPNA
jgi:hypothetical protein